MRRSFDYCYPDNMEAWVSGLNQFPAKEPSLYTGFASPNLAASALFIEECCNIIEIFNIYTGYSLVGRMSYLITVS